MRRLGLRPPLNSALFVLLLTLGSAWACSNDDAIPAPIGSSGSAGKAAGDGGQTQAGSSATPGDGNGGVGALGGAPGSDGGSGTQNGGVGNSSSGGEASGGASSDGGAPPLPAGGAGAGEGTGPNPPDLITASGGPWPDSLTGACSSPSKAKACPGMADPFFGQDGTYRLNVPSYTATATTLKDSVTSLVWQLVPEQLKKSQPDALAYCDALELAGQTDWRLPTRLEYVSLLDEGMGSGYAMPPAVPIDTVGNQWTASATGTAAGQFFSMNDQVGAWTVGDETTQLGARCVRGPVVGGSLQVE